MFDHLSSLQLRHSSEKRRLASSKDEDERQMRAVVVAQIEREMAAEREFIGLTAQVDLSEMTDDELLQKLQTP